MKQALIENLEEEIRHAEREMQEAPRHKFSRHYKRRKKAILAYAKNFEAANERRVVSGRPGVRRVAMILISAVMLLVSASVAVAIAKPGLYYIIKDKLISWDITFDCTESADDPESSGFEYITPTVPEEFKVVEETRQPGSHYIEFENQSGENIGVFQTEPGGAMISVDSEHHKKREVTVNGRSAVVLESNTDGVVVFEDGVYAYSVEGNCDIDILIDIAKEILK